MIFFIIPVTAQKLGFLKYHAYCLFCMEGSLLGFFGCRPILYNVKYFYHIHCDCFHFIFREALCKCMRVNLRLCPVNETLSQIELLEQYALSVKKNVDLLLKTGIPKRREITALLCLFCLP